MTDAAKAFYADLAEKRRTARGSHAKVTGRGKTVTLPNDGLTLKEVREINGTPTSYKLNEPVQWADFRAWPEDIQREYLEGLQSKYRVGLNEIARMMGAREASFADWKTANGIKSLFNGRSYPTPEWADFKARAAWLEPAPEREPESGPPGASAPTGKGAMEREPEKKTEKDPEREPEKKQEEREPKKPKERLTYVPVPDVDGEALEKLLALLPTLKAAGAKIRIEVEL